MSRPMITSACCQSECLRHVVRSDVTIEIRRKRRVVGNASEGIETDSLNHELPFGEELECEAFE